MYAVQKEPFTHAVYGYPTAGAKRRRTPKLLICIHITDNCGNLGPSAATNERNYANGHSGGPSAHNYLNRNGSVVAALDPARFAAWSNGDLKTPNKALPYVKTILAEKALGFNPNEVVYREVECCGCHPNNPVSNAQKMVLAQLIAQDSIATGIAISRDTVGTHADINTETRTHCAFTPATREAELAAIIAKAKYYVSVYKLVNAGSLGA